MISVFLIFLGCNVKQYLRLEDWWNVTTDMRIPDNTEKYLENLFSCLLVTGMCIA